MKKYQTSVLLTASLFLVSACDSGERARDDDDITLNTHNVSIVAIDAVNQDSGESVDVDGLPAGGGVLIVD